jgi:GntR family phosphonate transport system transcriptional regulator
MGRNRYAEIVDAIAGDLAECEPGTRVASEHELAARFEVSRAVAGAALRELENRLLVRRVRGSGTFVNGRIDYVISPKRAPSWHRTVLEAGAEPHSEVRGVESVTLVGEQAGRLERPEGSAAHRLARQLYINGMVAGWIDEWIPDDVFPAGADVAVRAVESLDQILRQMASVEPVRAWCRVSMELPPPEVAERLEIDQGRHTWLIESVSRDGAGGRPLMCSSSWTRPDVVRVIVEMPG